VLEVNEVRFGYPDCSEIIKGISFSLEKGERLAIVGENGSGKTTLARLMCGLLAPTSGAVLVDGIDTCDPADTYEARRRAGIVFQDPEDQIVETNVEREISFGPRNLGLTMDEVESRAEYAISLFRLGSLRKRPCHLLSAGEKQTVAIASVFAMKPDYVILDESTSLLDSVSRRQAISAIERLLEETGAGLAFISMRVEDIWMCEHAVFIRDGGIGFAGDRIGLLDYFRRRAIPLGGTALFISKMDGAYPGFAAALARSDSLSPDALASAARAVAPRRRVPGSEPGSGSGSAGGSGEGGSPCP
jgi:energy-coupling factor transport system ATP-binding protein